MKGQILIAGLAAAALAIPAGATAQVSGSTHLGKLVGTAHSLVRFDEIADDEGRAVTKFTVRGLEVACSDGITGKMRLAKLTGRIGVGPSGGFKATTGNGEARFTIRGKITGSKASGTVRFGGAVPHMQGATRDCYSGRVGWVTRP